MSTQQWEFCELGLTSWKSGKPNWSYNCHIRYFSSDGKVIFRQLTEIDKPVSYDPFSLTMGLLGGMGWELVTVQHGEFAGGMSAERYEIRYDNRVAYFKRPTLSGRAVNEPELALT